jgi:DNA-binding NarL/FixJ family response regulator
MPALFPLAQSTSDPRIWIALGFGTLVLVYLVMRSNRPKRDPLDRPSAFTSLSQQRSVERQMQNLLVELNDMARQMSAQLDTRAAKLEQLIADADDRLARLQSATRGAPEEPAPTMRLTGTEDRAAEIDPRHADVYRLADAGRSPTEIAQQLNRPRGEIELILALRR